MERNPPVHAWACWRVYKLTVPRRAGSAVSVRRLSEAADQFHLVGQPQGRARGKHLFSGGFSGAGQASLRGALELSRSDPVPKDIASKFFEHFVLEYRRTARFRNDRDALLFHQYFHGETGAGLGAPTIRLAGRVWSRIAWNTRFAVRGRC